MREHRCGAFLYWTYILWGNVSSPLSLKKKNNLELVTPSPSQPSQKALIVTGGPKMSAVPQRSAFCSPLILIIPYCSPNSSKANLPQPGML